MSSLIGHVDRRRVTDAIRQPAARIALFGASDKVRREIDADNLTGWPDHIRHGLAQIPGAAPDMDDAVARFQT